MSHDAQVIAVYGGSFDPFHQAHEAVCEAVLSEPLVSALHIVPCFLSPFKASTFFTAEQRLAAVDAWARSKQDSRIVIDAREVTAAQPSFTVSTLQSIHQNNPNSRLVFILGSDAFSSLYRWHQAEKLPRLASFWVFARSGEAPSNQTALTEVTSLSKLIAADGGHFYIDHRVNMDLASSEFRQNSNWSQWPVPKAVLDFLLHTNTREG